MKSFFKNNVPRDVPTGINKVQSLPWLRIARSRSSARMIVGCYAKTCSSFWTYLLTSVSTSCNTYLWITDLILPITPLVSCIEIVLDNKNYIGSDSSPTCRSSISGSLSSTTALVGSAPAHYVLLSPHLPSTPTLCDWHIAKFAVKVCWLLIGGDACLSSRWPASSCLAMLSCL